LTVTGVGDPPKLHFNVAMEMQFGWRLSRDTFRFLFLRLCVFFSLFRFQFACF